MIVAANSICFGQETPTTLTIAGINGAVTVRRDNRSIPYIEAKDESDLYFGQGYTTAGDRLFQMDMMRRLARGEMSEIFGTATIEEDKRWRRFGFSNIADESIQYLSPDLKIALESYAKGVNAYIASLADEDLPVECRILQYRPKDWRPSDSIIVGKILSDALSTTWKNDLIRASLQGLPADKLADLTGTVTTFDLVLFGTDTRSNGNENKSASIAPVSESLLAKADAAAQVRESSLSRIGLYAEELAASNNWVISGSRTASGKPILANDPHLAATAPGIWYMTHLSTPTMRVSGVTFPGVPGIVLGHNENITWGATNVGPDVQDLYIETFNEKGEYKSPVGWKSARVRSETILVRKNPLKTETDRVTLDVVETDNGPIILEDGGKKYALKWTAFDPKNSEFEVFYRWNRAKNWTDFKGALKNYGGAAQNFVYADVKGNIGWYAASKIPIRRKGDGSLPYDGSTTDGDWMGSIPFEELPNLYNPKSGIIVTANQRIVGTSYKYTQVSRDAAPPWRARRIFDRLSANGKVTFDDVNSIQHDVFNIPLSNLAKEIVRSNAASPATIGALKDWDGLMTPDSRGALLSNELRGCLADEIAAAIPPAPSYIVRERILDAALREKQAKWLPSKYQNYNAMIGFCDSKVRSSLSGQKQFGPDDAHWVWGKVWQSSFRHPLAAIPFVGSQFATPRIAMSGSGQTPNVGSSVSMRHIASPGAWDLTRLVIPLGQSGSPSSPFFKDQFDMWNTGEPAGVFPFTKKAVDTAANVTAIFQPKRSGQ